MLAVFISDLHLHPERADLLQRFDTFIQWVKDKTQQLYILGDFFHVWAGDEQLDVWSLSIAAKLKQLTEAGITIYFMPGNRDFLLGKPFFQASGVEVLSDPTVITLGNEVILLAHGDSYCIKDVAHQRLRKLTRNKWFPWIFLKFPFSWRLKMTQGLRKKSQSKPYDKESMQAVKESLIHHMQAHHLQIVIHGHTHTAGKHYYVDNGALFQHYILSDWDDNPAILCYDKSKGFYFIQNNWG